MNQKNLFSTLLIIFLFIHCTNKKNKSHDDLEYSICELKIGSNISSFNLKVGDILFQDLDSDPLCDAIEIVTHGYKGSDLSHVGIVIETGDSLCRNQEYIYNDHVKIVESLPGGTKITHLDSFLNRSYDKNGNPKVIVGRLIKDYKYSIPKAISFIIDQIGEEYDDAFLINNDKYYCSELIFEAFSQDSIFKLNPMTFLDPKTKKTQRIWIEYYKKLKIKVPEGELGINPGIMSLSNKIEIVHLYGKPDGIR